MLGLSLKTWLTNFFLMDENFEKKEVNSCESCNAACCRYVAMEIDCPEELADFENIKWYVCHKNVKVYVEEDGTWNVEFITPCKWLGENNRCTNYDQRPAICKSYNQEECTFHNNYEEKFSFESIGDVEKYIEEIFKKGEHVIPDEDYEEDDEEDYEEDED